MQLERAANAVTNALLGGRQSGRAEIGVAALATVGSSATKYQEALLSPPLLPGSNEATRKATASPPLRIEQNFAEAGSKSEGSNASMLVHVCCPSSRQPFFAFFFLPLTWWVASFSSVSTDSASLGLIPLFPTATCKSDRVCRQSFKLPRTLLSVVRDKTDTATLPSKEVSTEAEANSTAAHWRGSPNLPITSWSSSSSLPRSSASVDRRATYTVPSVKEPHTPIRPTLCGSGSMLTAAMPSGNEALQTLPSYPSGPSNVESSPSQAHRVELPPLRAKRAHDRGWKPGEEDRTITEGTEGTIAFTCFSPFAFPFNFTFLPSPRLAGIFFLPFSPFIMGECSSSLSSSSFPQITGRNDVEAPGLD
mmetsp:Transcript_8231/g.24702  ORF Transcript_8231/g.24702 Transcript_8231/m.24702 type:complete len:364 (+) Transcript_8231:2691-3782(+)